MSWDLYEFSLFWLLGNMEMIPQDPEDTYLPYIQPSVGIECSMEVFLLKCHTRFPPCGLLFILLGTPYHGSCKLPIKYSFGKKKETFTFQFTCIIIDLFLWVPNLDLFLFVLHGKFELIWVRWNTSCHKWVATLNCRLKLCCSSIVAMEKQRKANQNFWRLSLFQMVFVFYFEMFCHVGIVWYKWRQGATPNPYCTFCCMYHKRSSVQWDQSYECFIQGSWTCISYCEPIL